MAKKPNKFLFWFGIVMMVLGFILLIFQAIGTQQMVIGVNSDFGSITAEDVPTYNGIMIVTGAVLIFLGLIVFITSFKIGR